MSKALRGEVWDVEFRPAVGAEIQKARPAVVMNVPEVGRLPLCIVVPITEWKPAFIPSCHSSRVPSGFSIRPKSNGGRSSALRPLTDVFFNRALRTNCSRRLTSKKARDQSLLTHHGAVLWSGTGRLTPDAAQRLVQCEQSQSSDHRPVSAGATL